MTMLTKPVHTVYYDMNDVSCKQTNMVDSEVKDNENSDITALKKKKPGLIYLSSIPPTMNVLMIRQVFQKYGEVGRVFLQPDAKEKKKGKPVKSFTEGWVEFKKKKIAKQVAQMLNNKQVGGKRRSKYYDYLWNIKYLPGFKWTHLNERLAYEKAVHDQRLRTEISQVKRETNFYVQNVERNKRLEKLKKRKAESLDDDDAKIFKNNFTQISTDESIRKKTKVKSQSSILSDIFTGGNSGF